jgi:hypothetical protein
MKLLFLIASCVFLLSMLALVGLQVAAAAEWVSTLDGAFVPKTTPRIVLVALGSFGLSVTVGLTWMLRALIEASLCCPFCRGSLKREDAPSGADPAFSCQNCGQITRTKAPVAPAVAPDPRDSLHG